jgi:hypothetical protein
MGGDLVLGLNVTRVCLGFFTYHLGRGCEFLSRAMHQLDVALKLYTLVGVLSRSGGHRSRFEPARAHDFPIENSGPV